MENLLCTDTDNRWFMGWCLTAPFAVFQLYRGVTLAIDRRQINFPFNKHQQRRQYTTYIPPFPPQRRASNKISFPDTNDECRRTSQSKPPPPQKKMCHKSQSEMCYFTFIDSTTIFQPFSNWFASFNFPPIIFNGPFLAVVDCFSQYLL